MLVAQWTWSTSARDCKGARETWPEPIAIISSCCRHRAMAEEAQVVVTLLRGVGFACLLHALVKNSQNIKPGLPTRDGPETERRHDRHLSPTEPPRLLDCLDIGRIRIRVCSTRHDTDSIPAVSDKLVPRIVYQVLCRRFDTGSGQNNLGFNWLPI